MFIILIIIGVIIVLYILFNSNSSSSSSSDEGPQCPKCGRKVGTACTVHLDEDQYANFDYTCPHCGHRFEI